MFPASRSEEAVGVVRNEAIHTAGACERDLLRIVDGVNEHLQSRLVKLPHKFRGDAFDGHAGVGRLRVQRKSRRVNRHPLQQSNGLRRRIARSDRADFLVQKRGVVHRPTKAAVANCRNNSSGNAGRLDFQHQTCVPIDGFKDFDQSGNGLIAGNRPQRPDLIERVVPDQSPPGGGRL